jgi:hypothetical protein
MIEMDQPSESKALLDKAVRVWRKAQVLYMKRSWEGQPEAKALVEELAQHPELESSLFDLLEDSDQLIAAYSLLTLELMGSTKLKQLPSTLLTNRSKVTILHGSFSMSSNLGSLAREVQTKALTGGK